MNAQTFAGLNAAQQRFATLLQAPGARFAGAGAPLHPCAVHVSAGLHRGAVLRLRGPAQVGSAADDDIVLRDEGVRPHQAELRRVDGSWSVFASSDGEAEDRTVALAAVQSVHRGRFLRQRYAIGGAELVLTQTRPPEPVSVRAGRSLRRSAGPLLIGLSALLGVAFVVELASPAVANMPLGTRNLAAEGWPDVNLVATADTPLQATGYVDDVAQLARLREWLQKERLAYAAMQVRVGSEITHRVREALGDPTLSVTYAGGGTVRVQGTSDDMAARDRLRMLVADLAGVVRIDDRVAFYEVPNTAPRQFSLPVRIVNVRPGEHGSFAGDNGSRYFVGAVLPDGAVVTAIKTDSIEFAFGDRRITYPLN